MILIIKNDKKDEVGKLINWIKGRGLDVHMSEGENTTIVGLIGDTSKLDIDLISSLDIVEAVKRIQEPYKKANRKFHPADTVIDAGGVKIGGNNFILIAGPCSVESEEQIIEIAEAVKKSGAHLLRGGAFKPRTPYTFQGLGLDGLELLKIAREKTGLPIVTEIMSPEYCEVFAKDVDVIQIGARNMQNFTLLREVGLLGGTVLLKRGASCSLDEMLQAADYILMSGRSRLILCERGIRTFETATRNTLDLSAVPVLKKKSHLPVVVDPSHGTGRWDLVFPMALAAVAAGADGLMIEVHNNPEKALCDGAQSITPALFHRLMQKVNRMHKIMTEDGE